MAYIKSEASCCESSGKDLDGHVDNGEEDEIDIIGITNEKERGEDSRNQLSGKVDKEEKIVNSEEFPSSNSTQCTDNNHPREAETTTEIKDKLQSKSSTTFASDVTSLRPELTSIDSIACNGYSSNSSASSTSRRSSVNSTDHSKNNDEKQKEFDNELEVTGQYSQSSDDEDDDFKSSEPYERFFFESDYLALKDNKQ